MKKVFTLIAIVAAFAASFTLSAKSDKDAPLAINRLQDNIFVGGGAGVNTILDNGFLGKTGLGTDLFVGKWLIPSSAVRMGWHGLSNQAVDTSNGWFAGEDSFGFNYLHIDWIWDVLNQFKYSDTRIVSPRIGATAGAIFTAYQGVSNVEFGYGFVLQVAGHIGKRVEAFVEGDLLLAREEAYRNAGRLITFPYLTAGVAVNIGKVGFERKVKTVTETVEVVKYRDCDHDGRIKGLLAQIDSLKAIKDKAPEHTVEYRTRPAIIYFDLDKDFLTRREKAHLEFLASHLPEGASLYITGHADKETGNPRHNLDLSRRRSETIAKALRGFGVSPERIHTDFKGDTNNISYSEDQSEKNRCCYIQVVLD